MRSLEEICDRLQAENINDVAKSTKLNYQQVWRIKAGVDKNPTYKTLQVLDGYFDSKPALTGAEFRATLKGLIADQVSLIIDEFTDEDILVGNSFEKVGLLLAKRQ